MQTHISDEHHLVLPRWFDRCTRNQTLVCFDAHLDLQQIGRERLRHLDACKTSEQVQLRAQMHHLLPDGDSSYGIGDFLYAARHMGMIDHLVWVAPPHVEIEHPVAAVEELRALDGVETASIDGAQRRDVAGHVVISTELLGLKLTVCRWESLPSLNLADDIIVDVDIDYFVSIPGDHVWIHPQEIASCIKGLVPDESEVTIARSIESGFTPIHWRFLADLLSAYLTEQRDAVDHFEDLFAATIETDEGNIASAFRRVHRQMSSYPSCAATQFLAAQLSEAPLRPQHQKKAQVVCSDYRRDPLRVACEYLSRQLTYKASDVRLLQEYAESEVVARQTNMTEVLLTRAAIGLMWCKVGQLDAARDCYDRSTELQGGCRELALEIGKQLMQQGQDEEATPYLQGALNHDNTHTAATYFLGQVAMRQGDVSEAHRCATEAISRAPAWTLPKSLLDEVTRQMA